MNKKLIFVNLSIECGYNSGINHGIAFLVPIAKRHSYDVACLNIHHEISPREFRDRIADFDPSIVGFSFTSHQLKYLIKYSRELERYPEILQIAGGVGSTLDPEQVLSQSSVKGACLGEGDVPLDNLLKNISNKRDISNTEGFYWRVNGNIKKNSVPQFTPNLSTIDFPDYTVFERRLVVDKGNFLIMLSRGCPYNCYYCCNKALSSVYSSCHGYFRVPSVEYSIELLERLITQYPETEFISFEDDLLIANESWFKNFSEQYRKKINKPYRICARVECITEDIADAMKSSGCKDVFLGLESGNEQIRKDLLNRKYSNELLLQKCQMIKKAGLDLFTFNIVGFPFEGRKEMEETFELNKKIAPNMGVCTFFYPYKRTELYKMCETENLLKSDNEMMEITNYNTRPSIKMTTKQEKACRHLQRRMENYFWSQNERTKISHAPSIMKKCLAFLWYTGRLTLRAMPSLYAMARKFYQWLDDNVFTIFLKRCKARVTV